jgi:pilus assembly protein FimV
VTKRRLPLPLQRLLDLLEKNPRDVALLAKIADAFQRLNDQQTAAQYFARVAEEYANDGYFLKGVALYKQVLRLDPELMGINVRLANLHFQLGLQREARAYLVAARDGFRRAARNAEAEEVERRLLALEDSTAKA